MYSLVKSEGLRRLSPLLRLQPLLLESAPSLLIAEPLLFSSVSFFVIEFISLITVLKSYYYET